MLKKLFSHTAIYGLAPQVSKLAYFFALPFITVDLTEKDFGVSGIMTAYTTAISIFASLGLNLVLVNAFYRSPNHYKWGWRQIYGFLTLWNFFYALLLGSLLYWAVPKEAENDKWLILLLNILPLVFFGQTSIIGNTFFRIKQLPFQIAVRAISFGLLNVILSVVFIKKLKMGYMGWFWATFIATMCSNLSYWYSINIKHKLTPIFNFKWRYIKRSLKISLPTIPHYYSGYLLGNSDKMIMDFFKVDTTAIGKYQFANLIAGAFESLSYATSTAAGPLMNEFYIKKKDLSARNMIFILQVCFFIMTFLASIWSKEMFHWLIKNDSLAQTYPLAIIFFMAQNYRPMYIAANAKLFYLEKTNVLWKVSFIAGVGNVGLNLILIPLLGFKIAAITTFISYMYMGYSGFFLNTSKEMTVVNYYPVFWLFCTVALTLLSYYIVELDCLYKTIITLIGGFLVGLGFFKRLLKLKLN